MQTLQECISEHKREQALADFVNLQDNTDLSDSFWDDPMGSLNNALGINSSTFQTGNEDIDNITNKLAQQAKEQAAKEAEALAKAKLNEVLQGGKSSSTTNKTGVTAPSSTDTTDSNSVKNFLSTTTGAVLVGASVGTGTYIATKKSKNRIWYALGAGAISGIGTHYLTR